MTLGTFEHYHHLCSSGDLVHDPQQENAARRLDRLAHELAGSRSRGFLDRVLGRRHGGPRPRGVWLHGGVGTGKSMLMGLFFERVQVEGKQRHHFHGFMRHVHRAIQARQKTAFDANDTIRFTAETLVGSSNLLCFDEFHVADIADAMILGRLFEQFLGLGVVMVATSNQHPRDLYHGGINRQLFLPFVAMLEEELDIVEVDAARDYRLAFLAHTGVYIPSVDTTASQALDDAFRHLIGDADIEPLDIPVQGRVLHVPRQARHVARFTFDELCCRPLAGPDYLALAESFHTVIIDDIPAMTPERRNEARRFVTLIDILYANRVGLLCSAEVPPDGLYSDGDGAFEFRRTASRLVEMQSAEYLESRRELSQEGRRGRPRTIRNR